MIKIEKIVATNATVIRNDIKQALLTGSKLTPEELASITAVEGTVVYSVNEQEVKTLVFIKPEVVVVTTDNITPVITKPAIKQPAPRATKVIKPE
jgi:hypothetical protein